MRARILSPIDGSAEVRFVLSDGTRASKHVLGGEVELDDEELIAYEELLAIRAAGYEVEIVEETVGGREIDLTDQEIVLGDYVQKDGEQWCVHSEAGENLGCHDSEEEAQAHLRAIEASKHAADAQADAGHEVWLYDVVGLGKAERTPQGGLRIPAKLAKVGVHAYPEYPLEDGSPTRQYVPPSVLFDPRSVATLQDAPLTLYVHPRGRRVSAETWKDLSVGHVRDAKRAGDYLVGTVVVQDARAVAAIEAGDVRELSCGYKAVLRDLPGTSPQGDAYDVVQGWREYNHATIVPRGTGRHGREVALEVDSRDDDRQRGGMKLRIDGVEYEVTDAAVPQAIARYEDKIARERKAAEAERDVAVKARDEAAGKLAASEKALADAKDATSEEALAKRVAGRLALLDRARKLAPRIELDATQTDRALMETAIKAFDSKADYAGESEDFVRGVFLHLSGRAPQATIADARRDALPSPGAPLPAAGGRVEQARAQMIRRNQVAAFPRRAG